MGCIRSLQSLIVLVFVSVLATPVVAQISPEEAAARLKAKEAARGPAATKPSETLAEELGRVKRENQSLKEQLAAAQAEVARLNRLKAAAAPQPAPIGTRVVAGHMPAGGKFTSGEDVFGVLPDAVCPPAGGTWRPLHAEMVEKWTKANLEGKTFDGDLTVIGPAYTDPDYGLTLPCASATIENRPLELIAAVVHFGERQTRQVANVGEGDRVHVVGTMSGFAVEIQTGGPTIAFTIKDAVVKAAGQTKK